MATSNINFGVGLRNPNFKNRDSSSSELSSDYSDEEFKKMPKAQVYAKETAPDENILPEALSHKSRSSSSKTERTVRESSVSSVSSQLSSSSKKKRQKRRRKKKSCVTNQMLEEAKSKNKYIPGLAIEKSPSSPLPATNKELTSKCVISNTSESSMPSKNGYTKISFIKERDAVSSSTEMVPPKNSNEFPIFASSNICEPVDSKYEKSYSQLAAMHKKPTPTINPALKPISVESWPFAKDENPLKKNT